MVACAAVILSSCSKDDKNDSSPDKAKKRIVRVIYKDNSKTPSSQDISYQYDKEGKLIKTVDIYNGSPSTETFSYSANKIASILIDTKNITYNIDYLLDSNGRITQYSQEGDETSYSETYTYDNNGYVQSVQPQDDDYCLNFLWGNGNLMNVSGKGKKWEFVYNSDPCPSNIELPNGVETIISIQSSLLTRIEIPASVETIKVRAFHGCSSLATVTFEQGSQLKTIDEGVFQDCSALTRIEIPASVETIKVRAFHGCSSLATVTFEQGSQLKTIGGRYDGGAFTNCPKLMTFDASACMSINEIQQYAFYQCQELRLFKIGTAVPPTCGASAFYGINPYSVLKVPSGCADTYKTANEWNNFASITGLDE